MADYIYLLQNRLTPAQRRALEAVREAARSRSMPVFLVGGAVRDLSSGTPVRDLDFAVQGDPSALVEDLAGSGAVVAGRHPVLSSIYLTFQGGVRVELGPTLAITYPKPGQAETQPAAILEDLRRRDFTANAMAVSLNEGSFGLLLDPLNGIADLENRELRLASNYGFIEQPALLLRAARLSARLGWTLEERTQARYQTGKDEGYVGSIPAFERGYELQALFHEDDPLAALEHLREEGWGEVLFPAWDASKADTEALDRVRDLMGQMEQVGIFVDPSPVFFPLLTARLSHDDVTALKAAFALQGFVQQVDSLEARSKELAQQLSSKSSTPSEIWKLLFSVEPDLVLWLAYTTRTGQVQARLKAFLNEWPQARQRLPYALMQEMRITPDLPGYEQLLEDLFFAQIDGKLATPEATRAFLEPFSPPAPVQQTAPRRRPAKSARGRGKKVVEEVAPPESEDADESEDRDEREDSEEAEDTDDRMPLLTDALADAEDSGEDRDDDDPEDTRSDEEKPRPASKSGPRPQTSPAGAHRTPAKAAGKAGRAPQEAPAAEAPRPQAIVAPGTKQTRPAATVKAPAAPVQTVPPAVAVKTAPPAQSKTVAKPAPAKKTVDTVVGKASATSRPAGKAPAKEAVPAAKGAPVKRVSAPVKAVAVKSSPAKAAVAAKKTAPSRAVASRPAPPAAKPAARGSASAKAVGVKKAASKSAVKKAVASRGPTPANRANGAASKSAAKKAPVKAASKGRRR